MRRVIPFASKGYGLVGTLDEAPGRTGLLIVSGGNEVRAGAHRGMARLAASLASQGIPVFRFDRRGVGDSAGPNGGYADSKYDIFNAVRVFGNLMPAVERIVGFGNCDAAAALALFGRDCGVDAAILANPWLRDETDALPPAVAIRARYLERLRDPDSWIRLLFGGVNIRQFFRGLRKLLAHSSEPTDANAVLAGIERWGQDATIILAERDATAIAFADAAKGMALDITTIDTASHSFAGEAGLALEEAIFRRLT